VTFPNVLVLNYLKQTKQASPEVQLRAENYIALGYQRLLTFEVKTGGFSIFGSPPASVMLTAKGLLETSDMAKVYPVDPALLERTRAWLLTQQAADGTWAPSATWDSSPYGKSNALGLTAYVTWALLESGAKDNAGVGRAIAYIKEYSSSATDAYVLALAANALVAYDATDPTAQDALARLDQAKTVDADTAYWSSQVGSFTGSYGLASNIETTGLAAYAFQRAHVYPDTAQRALNYLVQKKDPQGTWGSTQATILALRALIQSVIDSGDMVQEGTVNIAFNGTPARPITINRENAGVVQLVTFDDVKLGTNRLTFKVEGKSTFAYQVSTAYYIPWESVPPISEQDKLVDIQVSYDRTSLAVDDEVGVNVRVRLTKEGKARMTLVDLGVPPGFAVVTEDLDEAVNQKTIARYELTGRQIIVYLEEFSSQQPVSFKYRLKAKFPLRAKTPSSTAYDYYNPSVVATLAPLQLTVQ
jgi:hypothetical protein